MEIDHALKLCRLVGLGHRSVRYFTLSAANLSVFRSHTITEKSEDEACSRLGRGHNALAVPFLPEASSYPTAMGGLR